MKRTSITTVVILYVATLLTWGQQVTPTIPKALIDAFWKATMVQLQASSAQLPAATVAQHAAAQNMRDVCGTSFVLTQASNGHDFVCVAK